MSIAHISDTALDVIRQLVLNHTLSPALDNFEQVAGVFSELKQAIFNEINARSVLRTLPGNPPVPEQPTTEGGETK